jgi:hypothetical protein
MKRQKINIIMRIIRGRIAWPAGSIQGGARRGDVYVYCFVFYFQKR